MNTDAGLTLPEPAATLWRTTRETVRHGLDALGEGIEYRIGGGTILAARWGHRTSFDIDLNLDERIPLSRLHAPEHEWFRNAVARLGGRTDHSKRLNLYNIRFGEQSDARDVQLWSHKLTIRKGQRREAVDGHNEMVLSTAQILRGKLQRASHKLARDVYDIRKASEVDPKSLEIAVNTISHKQLESLALDWILGYGKIGTNAHQRLKGLSEGEDRRHYALGKDGAAAVLGAAYERFRIRVAQDDIVVEAVTRAGHRRRMTTSSREADDVFEALGINGHLQQKEPGADEIRRYAIRLAQERAHDVLVFEEMNDSPTQWRIATRSLALPPITANGPAPAGTRDEQRDRMPDTCRDRG